MEGGAKSEGRLGSAVHANDDLGDVLGNDAVLAARFPRVEGEGVRSTCIDRVTSNVIDGAELLVEVDVEVDVTLTTRHVKREGLADRPGVNIEVVADGTLG